MKKIAALGISFFALFTLSQLNAHPTLAAVSSPASQKNNFGAFKKEVEPLIEQSKKDNIVCNQFVVKLAKYTGSEINTSVTPPFNMKSDIEEVNKILKTYPGQNVSYQKILRSALKNLQEDPKDDLDNTWFATHYYKPERCQSPIVVLTAGKQLLLTASVYALEPKEWKPIREVLLNVLKKDLETPNTLVNLVSDETLLQNMAVVAKNLGINDGFVKKIQALDDDVLKLKNSIQERIAKENASDPKRLEKDPKAITSAALFELKEVEKVRAKVLEVVKKI